MDVVFPCRVANLSRSKVIRLKRLADFWDGEIVSKVFGNTQTIPISPTTFYEAIKQNPNPYVYQFVAQLRRLGFKLLNSQDG